MSKKSVTSPCPWVYTHPSGHKLDTRRMFVLDARGRRFPIADKLGRGVDGALPWRKVNRMLRRGGRLVLELEGHGEVMLEDEHLDKKSHPNRFRPWDLRFMTRDASGEWVEPSEAQRERVVDALLLESLGRTGMRAKENSRHAATTAFWVIRRMQDRGSALPHPEVHMNQASEMAMIEQLLRSEVLTGDASPAEVEEELRRIARLEGAPSPDLNMSALGDPDVLMVAENLHPPRDSLLLMELAARGVLSNTELNEIRRAVAASAPGASRSDVARTELAALHSVLRSRDARGPRLPALGDAESDADRATARDAILSAMPPASEYAEAPLMPQVMSMLVSGDSAAEEGASGLLLSAEASRPGTVMWAALQADSPALAELAVRLLPSGADLRYVADRLSASAASQGSPAHLLATDLLEEPSDPAARLSVMWGRVRERPSLMRNPLMVRALLDESSDLMRALASEAGDEDWAVAQLPDVLLGRHGRDGDPADRGSPYHDLSWALRAYRINPRGQSSPDGVIARAGSMAERLRSATGDGDAARALEAAMSYRMAESLASRHEPRLPSYMTDDRGGCALAAEILPFAATPRPGTGSPVPRRTPAQAERAVVVTAMINSTLDYVDTFLSELQYSSEHADEVFVDVLCKRLLDMSLTTSGRSWSPRVADAVPDLAVQIAMLASTNPKEVDRLRTIMVRRDGPSDDADHARAVHRAEEAGFPHHPSDMVRQVESFLHGRLALEHPEVAERVRAAADRAAALIGRVEVHLSALPPRV